MIVGGMLKIIGGIFAFLTDFGWNARDLYCLVVELGHCFGGGLALVGGCFALFGGLLADLLRYGPEGMECLRFVALFGDFWRNVGGCFALFGRIFSDC